MKFVWQISYPPANVANLGWYLTAQINKGSHLARKKAPFHLGWGTRLRARWHLHQQLLVKGARTIFNKKRKGLRAPSPVNKWKKKFAKISASPEIIGVEFRYRQTDRQNFDTICGWVCVFSPVKIFYLPARFARRGITIAAWYDHINCWYAQEMF